MNEQVATNTVQQVIMWTCAVLPEHKQRGCRWLLHTVLGAAWLPYVRVCVAESVSTPSPSLPQYSSSAEDARARWHYRVLMLPLTA